MEIYIVKYTELFVSLLFQLHNTDTHLYTVPS